MKLTKEFGIQPEAWSPLGHGGLVKNPLVVELAAKYDRTPGQLLLTWALQQGVVVISRTIHEARMKENLAAGDFTIEAGDMQLLNSLDEEKHSIWYDKYKWSGNRAGMADYLADPEDFR